MAEKSTVIGTEVGRGRMRRRDRTLVTGGLGEKWVKVGMIPIGSLNSWGKC